VALTVRCGVQGRVVPRADVARQVALEPAVERVLLAQPVVHPDRPDISAELIVRKWVDPTEVVYQPWAVGCRNEFLLKEVEHWLRGQLKPKGSTGDASAARTENGSIVATFLFAA